MNVCKVKGCSRASSTRGYCQAHYRRWKKNGTPDAVRPIMEYASSKERKRLMAKEKMRCCTCRKILPLTAFPPSARYSNNHECRECSSLRQITRQYNLTKDQYWRMRARQGDRCAICNTVFGRGMQRCCVDHDHADGKIRGLLCASCNTGIGHMRDNPALLYMAARYLDDAEERKNMVGMRRINKKRIRK